MLLICSGNPFIHAYLHSDWFGKGVFFALLALSICSWTVLIQKMWMLFCVRKSSLEFSSLFSEKDPLGLQFHRPVKGTLLDLPHPLFEMYKAFKTKALAIIHRNHFFLAGKTLFSPDDLDLLGSELDVVLGMQIKKFEKHLFILPTVVTLGPFVGLLGTVWGILLSFSEMQGKNMGEGMLAGLSLALATTVLGLVVAIPALIGHNYLKSAFREYRSDMSDFAHKLLVSIELHYTKGDHASQTSSS